MIRALPALLELILLVFCLVDAVSTPDAHVRNLPKWAWILLILLIPIAGPIAWLVAGRPTGAPQQSWAPPGFPEYDRPGRAMATNPDDDAEFLRKVRERADEQRRRYAEQKKREQEQGPDAPQQ